MAFEFLAQFVVTNAFLADSVLCQVFLEQMRFRSWLLVKLQADCVVVILLDVLNLNQAKVLGAVHHGKLTDIVVIVHSTFVNNIRTGHINVEGFIVLVNLFVFRVRENIPMLTHKTDLFFQLVRSP